jgi:hypothetical protein
LVAELESKPHDLELRSRLAAVHSKRGDAVGAKALLTDLPAGALEPAILFRLGQAAEVVKDRATALSLIERALAAGYSLDEISHDPELAELRADQRFHRMLARRDLSGSPSANTARRPGAR